MIPSRLQASLLVLGWLSCLAATSYAQEKLERPGAGLPTFEAPPAPEGPREKTDALMKSVEGADPRILARNVVTRNATVEAVDRAARVVTVRDDHGVVLERTVPPDVDLTQVKTGDRVIVKEIASVAVSVSPRALAVPPAEPSVVVETAGPGEKPARLEIETEEIAATLAAIDQSTHTVTLRDPDGSTRTVQVDPRVDLDRFNAGDQVTLRITKAFAVAVESPQ